jgi:hypothetical protein
VLRRKDGSRLLYLWLVRSVARFSTLWSSDQYFQYHKSELEAWCFGLYPIYIIFKLKSSIFVVISP